MQSSKNLKMKITQNQNHKYAGKIGSKFKSPPNNVSSHIKMMLHKKQRQKVQSEQESIMNNHQKTYEIIQNKEPQWSIQQSLSIMLGQLRGHNHVLFTIKEDEDNEDKYSNSCMTDLINTPDLISTIQHNNGTISPFEFDLPQNSINEWKNDQSNKCKILQSVLEQIVSLPQIEMIGQRGRSIKDSLRDKKYEVIEFCRQKDSTNHSNQHSSELKQKTNTRQQIDRIRGISVTCK